MAKDSDYDKEFTEHVGKSARRRIRARESERSVLSWLGTFGVIGWSVALPTLAGIAVGLWFDARFETGTVSWTITGLVVGLAVGLVIAWGWVRREGGRRD